MSRPSLRLRVPASTSNLGPGFDLLGLALGLWLEVRVRPAADGEAPGSFLRLEGEARAWPATDNLVLAALARGHALAGAGPLPPLVLEAHSEIPLARGLGSSGAAVAAGLRLGSALARGGEPLAAGALDAAGAELEGHPDNSTASLHGGCTLALPHPGGLAVLRQPLHPDLGLAVAWPTRPMPTAEARAALPRQVPLVDAIENPRRLAFLLEGLRRADPELLRLGEEDRLHVPHRLPLMPAAAEALEAARAAGAWLATLSGSGSTLVVLGRRGAMQAPAEALRTALASRPENGPCTARVVEPVLTPPDPETWHP